ncbi:hypothetical protein BB559_002841 [Furculomyces boomerangus]|uniref:ribose-phosphate diphosphokinase n=1 Tax=Furculomyces boomerangus TaxID=61424 RepID=A0A2T9YRS0_9FUNG|nr:hypothetical protein BB559_002841 [Furculomyces boomerangus]
MKNGKIFSGTSHPALAQRIAGHLSTFLSPVTVQRFPNQEITVSFGCSVRDQNVYIIQSGSDIMNDHIVELLIMIRAAKMSSARKVIVVMPYYPYSKQSKKKKHRGAITAKLVADMLMVSGADHIITLDLHAYQISGFFTIPVDNLFSKPIIAGWVFNNIADYKNAVVVAKNTGGAKRVTALADMLGIKFALIYVDNSHVKTFSRAPSAVALHCLSQDDIGKNQFKAVSSKIKEHEEIYGKLAESENDDLPNIAGSDLPALGIASEASERDLRPIDEIMNESDDDLEDEVISESNQSRTSPLLSHPIESNDLKPLNHSETRKAKSNITLVGDVSNKLALLVDDLIDRPKSFITVAEHLMKNCNCKGVYIFASHGLFTEKTLTEIEECPYIQKVIATNSYPISQQTKSISKKLVQVDVSPLLAEAIRRNHNGESISSLFERLS